VALVRWTKPAGGKIKILADRALRLDGVRLQRLLRPGRCCPLLDDAGERRLGGLDRRYAGFAVFENSGG
jgi:hypothetical protein